MKKIRVSLFFIFVQKILHVCNHGTRDGRSWNPLVGGRDTPSSSTVLFSTVFIKTLVFSRMIEHLSTLWFWTPIFSFFVHKPYILFCAPHDSKRSLFMPAVMPSTISLSNFEPCFATSCQLSFGSVPGSQRYLAQSADRLPLEIFH
jgi:hypothetical protein